MGYVSALAIIAAPPAVYYAIGDLSTVGPDMDPDYVMHPPSWSPSHVTFVGILALAVLASAVAVLIREHRREPILRSTLIIDALLISVGVIVAGGYRVVTAAVIGANIGAGILVLSASPIVIGLLIAAAVIGVRAHRQRTARRAD